MKRVMLLGDSIRMMTEAKVREKSGAGFEVWSPDNNCRYTALTLNELRHYNSDIAKYNAAAIELMEKEGILINDLHPLLIDDLDRFIDPIDWIHPTADGIEVLSDQIAKVIKEVSTQ